MQRRRFGMVALVMAACGVLGTVIISQIGRLRRSEAARTTRPNSDLLTPISMTSQPTTARSRIAANGKVDPAIAEAMRRSPDGRVSVIVALVATDTGVAGSAESVAAIRKLQDEVLTRVVGTNFKLEARLDTAPIFIGIATLDGIDFLARQREVVQISQPRKYVPKKK